MIWSFAWGRTRALESALEASLRPSNPAPPPPADAPAPGPDAADETAGADGAPHPGAEWLAKLRALRAPSRLRVFMDHQSVKETKRSGRADGATRREIQRERRTVTLEASGPLPLAAGVFLGSGLGAVLGGPLVAIGAGVVFGGLLFAAY